MGLGWRTIRDDIGAFIEGQKLFFVARVPQDGRVNLSQKVSVTEDGRITMMFFPARPDAAPVLRGRACPA